MADKANNKEWQRSKFAAAPRLSKFWAPQQDITGRPVRMFITTNNSSEFIYGDVSKWS